MAAAAVSLVGFVGANFIQQQSLGGADMSTAGPADSGGEEANGATDKSGSKDLAEGPESYYEPRIGDPDSAVRPPATAASERLATVDGLSQLLSRSTRDLYADSAFTAAKCGRPQRQAYAYEVNLTSARRAVVMVQRVNANAARVYVYPCGQSVVPVAASLLLGIR